MAAITPARIREAPKVLLHDHLDGGLRPATTVDLARDAAYRGLPSEDPHDLAAWFTRGADRKDLGLYLETFVHTVAVLQTPDALERVAAEAVEDYAADGVVYAEVRYAPELSQQRGLGLDEVVAAIDRGLARGAATVAAAGEPVTVRLILCAMRSAGRSEEIARLAVRQHEAGRCAAMDLAGPEVGHPASDHKAALALAVSAGVPLTLHAGEQAGVASVADAVDCHAARIGHGVSLAHDLHTGADGAVTPGPVASLVRDRGIPLEMCPTSNVHTGAATSVADHPLDRLRAAGLSVTLNTDNRLMSDVTASSEHAAVAEAFQWGWADLEEVSLTALDAAFCDEHERQRLREQVVSPGYAALSELPG